MSNLARQLSEDRAMRDTALRVLKSDIAHLKGDLAEQGVGRRLVGRASEGATDLFEQAVDIADDNRGALGALVAAVLIWFARNPILSLFSEQSGDEDADYPDDDISADEQWDDEPDFLRDEY